MKHIILGRIGTHETIRFACSELVRCLQQMDGELFLEQRVYEARDLTRTDILWIGLDGSVPYSQDDTICICVSEGAGVITGSNERSVLLAVYRMLYTLGCRWIRPGRDGERIPSRELLPEQLQVQLQERASYRHRAVCIEGANDYQHVADMIDWLPKVGMNGYFVQFMTPHTFFNRWYNHLGNPMMPGQPLTEDDVKHIWKRLEEEILRRGLMYHAVGHGWTCEPFGIEGLGWDTYDKEVPPETKQYFAEVNGKRELWGVPLDTNLCYSNPEVRNRVTDAIVNYCRANPQVDYLHFWLADGSNNHCECPACQTARPSDFYVRMLNELDEKLTAAGIPTRIVFLIYRDLFWEPEVETIRNQDRFVLMFAPIARTYTKAFAEDCHLLPPEQLAPYVRNKLKKLVSVSENITRLSRWQAQFRGDSFDFDYHMMWDHLLDPGYYECARILHKDMVNLDQIGLNGMVSCQNQRVFQPTGLPMYAMARGLWDKTSRFEDVVREYFEAAFDEDAEAVAVYMRTLSALFHPPYLRGELPQEDLALAADFAKIPRVVAQFRRDYLETNRDKSPAWKYLTYHADVCVLLSEILQLQASGQTEAAADRGKELQQYLRQTEQFTHPVFDTHNAQLKHLYGRFVAETTP